MQKTVKFSVLIPVYINLEFLNEALDSLRKQTFKTFNVKICSQGNTDVSKIVNEFKDLDIEVFHINTPGTFFARKILYQSVHNDYVVWLDADDLLAINALEILEKHIKETGFLDYYFFNFVKKDNRTSEKVLSVPPIVLSKNEALDVILNDNKLPFLCLKCLKTDLPISYIKENVIFGEDGIYTILFYEASNSFAFCSEQIYFYRRNEYSITNNKHYDLSSKKLVDKSCLFLTIEKYFYKMQNYKFYLNDFFSSYIWTIYHHVRTRQSFSELNNNKNISESLKCIDKYRHLINKTFYKAIKSCIHGYYFRIYFYCNLIKFFKIKFFK